MGDVQLDPRHHQGEYGGDGDFNQAVPDPWDGAAPAGPRSMGAALAIREQGGSLRGDRAVLVEGLTKRFDSVRALDGIDFAVPPGSVFGLLGPNGAGKTTVIRILTTILRPDGGHAEVLGIDVAREPAAVRHVIGLAGQYAAVDPNLTGQENLRLIGRLGQMASREVRTRSAELLERFDLAGAADRPVRTYSGGMRRRLDVAAALVSRPPVLFLDEPTTGLDLQSRGELWRMIRELVAEGTAVLLTTQYLEEADRLAQRIAVVDHGRVIANDTPAALKARLGSTVIELGMGEEARAARALELLAASLPARPEREAASLRLASRDGARVLIGVLRSLDDHDLTPATLAVREPSLDDVFLSLTGRRAEDAAGDGHQPQGGAP
jgi:ABC-2 type transport system ATP-binding protein